MFERGTMNIVKGVADLIRRTSGGQTGESGYGFHAERFCPPTTKIRFSEVGNEAILSTLWEKYENAVDRVEKRKLLHVFIKQFLVVYQNWEPVGFSELPDSLQSNVPPAEYSLRADDIVVGCSTGHPAEVIWTLIEEIGKLATLVMDYTSIGQSMANLSMPPVSLSISSEGLPILEALNIVARSVHNCSIIGYHGGIQKLVALLKATVVQLKSITGYLSSEKSSSNSSTEKREVLQKLLLHVMCTICTFTGLNFSICETDQLYCNDTVTQGSVFSVDHCTSLKIPRCETSVHWYHNSIISIMESGGLNWLVELLRVTRRLSMKQQWIDLSLQHLTLKALRSALFENPRVQNHFRSIGGLEALLDGLGLPSNSVSSGNPSLGDEERDEKPVLCILQLHVLSLEVLRDAIHGNLNNLQYLCENGRVHKFANSFCSPAFLLQEDKPPYVDFSLWNSSELHIYDIESESHLNSSVGRTSASFPSIASHLQCWENYVVKLSEVLCSFLFASEDTKSGHTTMPSCRNAMAVSAVYRELSIRWIMRVLLSMFPCLKSCLNENELPSHLRIFIYTLQNFVLGAFRRVIVSSPLSLDIFREEGMWDLIFSEIFFYFEPASEESFNSTTSSKIFEMYASNALVCEQAKASGVGILQVEVISFVEFAATLNEAVHNLPECSVLLDALEQSACNPGLACILAKSLLRILQCSVEKTIASFMTLDTIARVLKVACILAQEFRGPESIISSNESNYIDVVAPQSGQRLSLSATSPSCLRSMETCIELFREFLSTADDAKISILHSPTCIDCLFELFWEKELRDRVLTHILDLMKILRFLEHDQGARMQLCPKYLEAFTQLREREKSFTESSINLLAGIRDMLLINQQYYQDLFREGECFLHVVSLLNGNLDEATGEKLVINVLQTLTSLLANNVASKAAFRLLVGTGYQTLRSLLLDSCHQKPSNVLLSALLDMLVDGKFDIKESPVIKNEDVIILYLIVLQKSSESSQHHGLNIFLELLRDCISNQASCVRAGMLSFLLDWFSQEDDDNVVFKISQLIQVIGGHSISGKDIRKIFALLRSEKVGTQQKFCSLLLTSILSMLNEKGPTAFFDLNGNDSGILIRTPLQWPLSRGYSFSCWLRVERFPRNGTMGLFSFLTDSRKGCWTSLGEGKLIYESTYLKRQRVSLNVNLVRKKWHFLCVVHSIGRAFSGGSVLRCYVDGVPVSSERCSYSKVNELMTLCTIGVKIDRSSFEEDNASYSVKDSSSFLGQIGPVYLFSDVITSEQVHGMYSLGPSYLYSFLDNEFSLSQGSFLPGGIFDAKDGLASKIIFGLNGQASNGRTLFNVSPVLDHLMDKSAFEATVMPGTKLCSRRLLQQIIYCVGGVSVFFPLFTQCDKYEKEGSAQFKNALFVPITKDSLTAEVIELVASVLDENIANQEQMHLSSGFFILGFLLQSVPPQQLNLDTLSALKHLFNVLTNSGMSELLVKDAISSIFLNPLIWVYSTYKVQRELYMFLIQQFDNDPRLFKSLCRLSHVIDITCQFYWDVPKSHGAIGSRPLLHPITKEVIGKRPSNDEIHKIRLLLFSLGEMSVRHSIAASDIKALIAFFERNQDLACIEDILHMVIRVVSQEPLLASFLEQVNLIGGCQIFVNLLQREHEPIRLLSLQFLGRLLVALPSEKKGPKFFGLAVGRSRSFSDGQRKTNLRVQPIFSAMSDRVFRFPLTDHLCATLFDVLLGGASPKQVLERQSQPMRQKSKGNKSQFVLPQILVILFRFLSSCEVQSERMRIIRDLLDLLDSNSSNIEAFMEYGWNSWLAACIMLDAIKDYKVDSQLQDNGEVTEQVLVRNLFCVVLSHYMQSVKGGWQYLEETVNFLLMHSEQDTLSYRHMLRDLYDDLIQRLVDLSSEDSIFISQPCRDNTLYLLRLVDEFQISEIDNKLPFHASSSADTLDSLKLESQNDLNSALSEAMQGKSGDQIHSLLFYEGPISNDENIIDGKWWKLFDNLWIIISQMYGKGPSKMLLKSSSSMGPSFGQRARGLVESLNIPAAEMAAIVVSGGIGNTLGGKSNKMVDKAMLLRGDRCPRIVFRLVILYLCKASPERSSRCIEQFISLLPFLLAADDQQSKCRLQLFIRALLAVRSQYGMLDDGARLHVISRLIRETVNFGKSVLVTTLRDDLSVSSSNVKETSTIHSLIQKDLVLAAVDDEAKYLRDLKADRTKQLHELYIRMNENTSTEINQKKTFEEEIQCSLDSIIASDDCRKAAFQLAYDEEQQNVAERLIHMFRALIDERGPWSVSPFPNSAVRHWKLDKTEDMWRRRPKLRQNYHFDDNLCHPLSAACSNEVILPINESKSGFGGHMPEQMKRFLLKGVHRITDEGTFDPTEIDTDRSGLKIAVSKDPSGGQYPELIRESNNQKDVQDKREPSSSPETESTEVLTSVPCVLVTPKRKLAGYLAVMKDALHFYGGFVVDGTAGSSVFKNFHALNSSDSTKTDQLGGIQKHMPHRSPITSDLDCEKVVALDNFDTFCENVVQKQTKSVKRHRRWNLCKVKSVHWTRYLLRHTAIELFFNDSTAPIFFNFASQKDARDVGTLIVATRNESLFSKGSNKDKNEALTFVDRRLALEMAETARESWRRREITNFEYLMILNTLAGRSYNDLTQYPVFPWILADYSSEVLDFNKSSTFRDLSKPVGALDPKRLEVFEDRYRNFCDPDIPSFYYGSHYSSMGIVLYYLLRLEPFTTLHRNLQGGKFDHADRLFQSIEDTYRNCLSNTSDVKELIPEFFYMPEFLINSNSYHLGVRQDGEPIGAVCLPLWAKGSPEEFINKNREALESEYVSSNLHHWIDLIFGYKQRGKPAGEAANVFYYLTYEGAVDLEKMEDELQRSAIEDQIANFGQTPIQIFRKKHPRRGPPIPIAHPLYFAPASINLTSSVSNTCHPPSPVVYIGLLESNIVVVNQGLTLWVKTWLTTQLQSGGNFTFSGSQDAFFGIGSDILTRKLRSSLAESTELGSNCFGTMQTPSGNFLISCGNWENSFQIISLNDGRIVQNIRQHKDVVSCVAVASNGSIVATGSYDTTVMLWEVNRIRVPEKRIRNALVELPPKDNIVSGTPFHILCGHDDVVTCLHVSVELDIVISGSRDGTCIFHTLREGRYVRSLRHPSGSPLSKLAASRHGRIVFYADDDLSLHLYSVNGKEIASCESNGRLNCVELSCCGEFLVSAGDQGQIVVRSMNSLEVVWRYSSGGKAITSLRVTPEECFLAGTREGSLLVYSVEGHQLRKPSASWNTKSRASSVG